MYVTMEHGHHSERQVAEMAAIARRLDWVLMIRPVDSAPSTLRKCMDLGCSGLVLPNVESAAELGQYPIVTLEKQVPNMIGNLV